MDAEVVAAGEVAAFSFVFAVFVFVVQEVEVFQVGEDVGCQVVFAVRGRCDRGRG